MKKSLSAPYLTCLRDLSRCYTHNSTLINAWQHTNCLWQT